METKKTIGWWGVMLLGLLTTTGFGQADFTSDVKTAPYPWSHTRFLETNTNFHFAVVADRNGGCRPGIFKDAVKKLNLLQPSFVISVGDFIPGYTSDIDTLNSEWSEFDDIIKGLEPPFFYVAGNHDYGAYNESKEARDVRAKLWQSLHGPASYYFVYKNTLFMCLNAMGAENHKWGLGEKQLVWAKDVLVKHPKVRWTFIFLHAPLWRYDGSDSFEKDNENPQLFVELEKTLKGRNYTVFAGHWHRYTYYQRQGMKYFVLATTGGVSDLRGPSCGEFDHIMWVSMTDSEPKFINLELSGMLPEDVCTEVQRKFGESIKFVPASSSDSHESNTFTLTFKNPFDVPLTVNGRWKKDVVWTVQPEKIQDTVPPGKIYTKQFHAEFNGNSWAKLPSLTCEFSAGSFVLKQDFMPQLNCFGSIWSSFSAITVNRSVQTPKIDGRLDDPVWKRPAVVDNLINPDLSTKAAPATQTWLAYDDQNLYVAWRCEEFDMQKLLAIVKERDGNVWNDDCVEFFIDSDQDRKTYLHFEVNPLGTLYDGEGNGNKTYNADAQVAASQDPNGWMVELAIPWKDLNVKFPKPGTQMNYEIARIRPGKACPQSVFQFPPLGIPNNHQPEYFGVLTLGQ